MISAIGWTLNPAIFYVENCEIERLLFSGEVSRSFYIAWLPQLRCARVPRPFPKIIIRIRASSSTKQDGKLTPQRL